LFFNLIKLINLINYLVNRFENLIDAVKYSFDNHYLPEMMNDSMSAWKKEKYYCEQVDNFIKAHLPFLDAMYKSWAPKKDPGRRE
jgi:hypothetical protein